MLIHLEPYKGSIRERVQYLLYGDDGGRNPESVLVFGNVGSFVSSGEMIPRKVKSFNFLVSFKESYEEFIRKLEKNSTTLPDFISSLLEELIPYSPEEYEVLVVGHKDTDHFHLHITVLNRHLETGKALYLPRTKQEVKFYQTLRKVFCDAYGFDLGDVPLIKLPVSSRKRTPRLTKLKESIAKQLAKLVKKGSVRSRSDVVKVLNKSGLVVVREWDDGIIIKYKDYFYTLTGGLFSENEFETVKRQLLDGQKRKSELDFESFDSLLEYYQELREKRIAQVRKRLLEDKAKLQRRLERERLKAQVRSERELPSLPSLSCSSLRTERKDWRKAVRKALGVKEASSPAPPTNTAKTLEVLEMKRSLPFTPEEIEKAKAIDPLTLVNYYGYEWERVGEQIRIKAPWREETEASVYLRVNPSTGHLIWKDFGGDQDGGSAIDFVMKASNVSFVEAVKMLLEAQGEAVLPEHPREKLPSSFSRQTLSKNYTHKVLKVKDKVDHTALISLLKRKGLDPYNLPPALKELHWEVSRNDGYKGRYFGLAVRSEGGSWIVRTALDKRPKTVVQEEGTYHSFAFCPAREGKRGRHLFVVEGITDYVALWQYLQKLPERDECDIVVLGGTGTVQDFIESGIWQDYNELFLGLDLDEAGRKAEGKIISALAELHYDGVISSLSRSLSAYGKDINEIVRESDLKFEVVYNPEEFTFEQENMEGWEEESPEW